MKKQFLQALENVSEVLTTAGVASEYEKFTAEEQEFYNVLMLCYDLMARTKLSGSVMIEQPEEMKEPGFEDDFIQKYGVASGVFTDFVFALTTRSGSVNMREMLRELMWKFTQQEVADGVGLRRATISEYLTGKTSMTCDNYEKILNFYIQDHDKD